MTLFGYFLSSEEFGPQELLDQAREAKDAGFEALWISDHYHPWNDEQGQSPFVWSMIGALSEAVPGMQVTTSVTCPTVRIHPAVIAQAAATAQVLLNGNFVFGIGSGEALNEHVTGARWPEVAVRLEMLEEAVEIVRQLWDGKQHNHHGKHYDVVQARIYTLPDTPPPIYISGFGEKSTRLAGRIGDGYIQVEPSKELVDLFRSSGGGDKPAQGGVKVCWDDDEGRARKTAHRLWATQEVPGQLAQDLPTPKHFEQASELVTEEHVAKDVVCGPDVDRHVSALQEYVDAGFDEVYVSQIGSNHEGFFRVYQKEVLPRLRS
jgi:G6PDH family F420-dependent oxidoreductase